MKTRVRYAPVIPVVRGFVCCMGFLFGCCLTVIITVLFLPAREFWPSTYEDRQQYIKDITLKNNFSYHSELSRFNLAQVDSNNTYETEGDYLNQKARLLCYSIEQEADDETHAAIVVSTWARYCDRMIMFYTSPRFTNKIKSVYIEIAVIKLVYIDPSNSTIGTLIKELSKEADSYNWFVYVPPKVYLLPNNLKYYLVASKIDPKSVAFSGRPDIGLFFGDWSVSVRSPLAISTGAILYANKVHPANSCFKDNIQGN